MSLELWLLFVVIALIATIFAALVYFGCFYAIDVKVGPSPIAVAGQRFAYKPFEGSYNSAGAAFTELYALLAKNVAEFIDDALTTIGIYYDDPDKVKDSNRGKYVVGIIMPNEDNDLFEKIERLLTDNDYKFASLPYIDHVVHTSFPYKGALSIVIAIRRVYPMLKHFINEHNLCARPAIELYKGDQMYFILPLAKQDQFYFVDDDDVSDQHSDSSHNGTADDETKSSSIKEQENGSQSDNAMSSQSSRSSFEELTIDGKD